MNAPAYTPKFFNRAQREAMIVNAHDSYYICSRALGKSEGFDARFLLQMVFSMPRSMGAFISPTYKKALQNTLPAICHALSRLGYIKGVHYTLGKAPKSLGFKLPYIQPLAWDNVMHWFNGSIMHILSFDTNMSANSMSLDWVIGPEAKFLDYDKIKNEVNPANRGNRQYFDECPWHHAVFYTTDMPTHKGGMWILDKEKEVQPDHISAIIQTYDEVKKLEAKPDQTDYTRRKITSLRADLNFMRRYQPTNNPEKPFEYTTHYAEYDIFDNIEIVGEDFVYQMKRDLPPLIFRTAILNERLGKVADGFYSALEESIHFYTPRTSSRLTDMGYNFNKTSEAGCLADGDLWWGEPLYISFDANSSISSMVVAQADELKKQMPTRNSFFVKTPNKLPELVALFSDYYKHYPCRDIVFYFDSTFVWTDALRQKSYADVIISELEKNRWNVTSQHIGNPRRHDLKHQDIDMALKGNPEYYFPSFNLHNTEYLKLAMEQTGIKKGRNGFEKDKSAEKLPDSPENPDERKTHITDAWDTLFVGINLYFTRPRRNITSAGFLGK